jgi:hypothetical protein
MTVAICLIVSLFAVEKPAPTPTKVAEQLQALHLDEAAKWQMRLDESGKERAELLRKPVYIWSNPIRSGGQNGSVFVWLDHGRPVVVGSIFSHPEEGRRVICNEFHSLALGRLIPTRQPTDQVWEPKAAITLNSLKEAPAPDSSAGRRLIQMRALSREFTAHSIDNNKERWELRLLPQPLYRYDAPTGQVIDGALFAYVTSAGTDPEVILALEAHRTGNTTAWYYRAIRFSDSDLFVEHKGKEVWTSIRDDRNQLFFNPDHTYRLLRDRFIDELPELQQAK